MPELEFFVVCRSVSTDLDTDELTLGNVIERFVPLRFPDYIDRIVAVSVWRVSGELTQEHQAILKVTPPDGGEGEEFPMNFAIGRERYRAIQSVLYVPVNAVGDILFEVFLNGKLYATHHIAVQPPEDSETDEENEEEAV